jgi:uncharacterized RDD family membrane protein YckC
MAERLAALGMQSASRSAEEDAPEDDSAAFGPRLLAYAVDSVVLFGFAMLFATLGGLFVLISSNGGEENPSDGAIWAMVLIIMATVPAWLALVFALTLRRGQTLGQYFLGLRVTGEDGAALSARRGLVYWLALHPLFYHPLFAATWALLAYVTVTLSSGFVAEISAVLFVLFLAIALLCLVAPFAGLAFALADPQRRAIHDRIAGARVVRSD